MEIFITAYILGLMGSFHCAGMCGPIAFSLPLRGNTFAEKLTGGILYNLGRTIMYGILGGIFGLIGQGFQIIGFQQFISIAMGVILILSVIIPFFSKNKRIIKVDFITSPIRKAIQHLFTMRSYRGLFLIGTLNSLLPCGLVYMAIVGAIAVGGVFYGMIYMILFGLGTLPMMLVISILGNVLSISVRNKLNKAIPYMVVFIAIIFIFRGLCLGIPYLSPPKEKLTIKSHTKTESIEHSCCHKE